jgi:putative aldouronate transport system permease protein
VISLSKSKNWQLYAMLLPAIVLTVIFAYFPIGGLVMAFQDYKPWLGVTGSAWVGLDQFKYLFTYPDSKQVIWNTFIIAILKIVVTTGCSVIFALLLNEVRREKFKRSIQTLVYLPHFLSWVILGGILTEILAVEGGAANRLLEYLFGIKPIFFLGEGNLFRLTVVVSDVWKEFGFGTIVFLAALAAINPSQYEAAEIDGAGRWQQTWRVTFPALLPMIIVVFTLALSNVLNAGFDQIFNLYNPLVYDKGDIIDTFVYRTGLISSNFSFATAVGLFKSVVSLILIVGSYRIAYKLTDYKIF